MPADAVLRTEVLCCLLLIKLRSCDSGKSSFPCDHHIVVSAGAVDDHNIAAAVETADDADVANLILSNTFRMGVVGMSKTMAREFGPYNIMVNTMGPGRIYNDRIKYLNTIRAEKAGITLEEYNTRDAASFPQKRYQTADEYARSVVFICSPANSAISGQVICVDGAMTTAY